MIFFRSPAKEVLCVFDTVGYYLHSSDIGGTDVRPLCNPKGWTSTDTLFSTLLLRIKEQTTRTVELMSPEYIETSRIDNLRSLDQHLVVRQPRCQKSNKNAGFEVSKDNEVTSQTGAGCFEVVGLSNACI